MNPPYRLLLVCSLLACLLSPAHADAPPPSLTPSADGGWAVSTPAYTAVVSKTGYLTSFKVGATETLGRPFTLDPDGGLTATDVTRTGDTLSAKMTGRNGSATISYTFRPDGFTIDPTFGGRFGRYFFQCSPALQGIELLNDKRAEAADGLQFVGAGEVRGVPAVRANRNQMVRFHFPGFALHAYCQRWGAPYNYEGAGLRRRVRLGGRAAQRLQSADLHVRARHTRLHPARPRLHAAHDPSGRRLRHAGLCLGH